MKRIIALLTVVIMVLSLAGCGDDKGATSKEDKIVNQDIGGAEFKLEEKGWEDKTTSKNYSFTSDDLNYDLSVSVTELSSNFTKNPSKRGQAARQEQSRTTDRKSVV